MRLVGKVLRNSNLAPARLKGSSALRGRVNIWTLHLQHSDVNWAFIHGMGSYLHQPATNPRLAEHDSGDQFDASVAPPLRVR